MKKQVNINLMQNLTEIFNVSKGNIVSLIDGGYDLDSIWGLSKIQYKIIKELVQAGQSVLCIDTDGFAFNDIIVENLAIYRKVDYIEINDLILDFVKENNVDYVIITNLNKLLNAEVFNTNIDFFKRDMHSKATNCILKNLKSLVRKYNIGVILGNNFFEMQLHFSLRGNQRKIKQVLKNLFVGGENFEYVSDFIFFIILDIEGGRFISNILKGKAGGYYYYYTLSK